jgi:hypothetical protein
MRLLTLKSEAAMAENKGNYTKPDLRERLKRRIMAGSDGGKSGEWS